MNLLDILNIDLKSLVKFNILVIRFIYNSLINYGYHEIIKFYRIANDYHTLPPTLHCEGNDYYFVLATAKLLTSKMLQATSCFE